jgi:hypothetical protein
VFLKLRVYFGKCSSEAEISDSVVEESDPSDPSIPDVQPPTKVQGKPTASAVTGASDEDDYSEL